MTSLKRRCNYHSPYAYGILNSHSRLDRRVVSKIYNNFKINLHLPMMLRIKLNMYDPNIRS